MWWCDGTPLTWPPTTQELLHSYLHIVWLCNHSYLHIVWLCNHSYLHIVWLCNHSYLHIVDYVITCFGVDRWGGTLFQGCNLRSFAQTVAVQRAHTAKFSCSHTPLVFFSSGSGLFFLSAAIPLHYFSSTPAYFGSGTTHSLPLSLSFSCSNLPMQVHWVPLHLLALEGVQPPFLVGRTRLWRGLVFELHPANLRANMTRTMHSNQSVAVKHTMHSNHSVAVPPEPCWLHINTVEVFLFNQPKLLAEGRNSTIPADTCTTCT